MADDPIPSPLETLKMKLRERQEKEYRELLYNQERRVRLVGGDAPNSMIEMHEKQRVEQQKKFADELVRYVSEYNESERVREHVREMEKLEALQRNEEIQKGRSR